MTALCRLQSRASYAGSNCPTFLACCGLNLSRNETGAPRFLSDLGGPKKPNLLQQTPNPTINLRLSHRPLSKARLLKRIGGTLSSGSKPQSRYSVWDLILEKCSAQPAESI